MLSELKQISAAAVIALSVAFGMGNALAQSSSSITVNGKKITVVGGSSQSMSATSTGAKMTIDGYSIIIDESSVSVDDEEVALETYQELVVRVGALGITIEVDGREALKPDVTNALASLTKRAEEGDTNSQFELALLYYNGTSVPEDSRKAFDWMQRSAEAGLAGGQFNTALFYQRGYGTEKDFKLAEKWLRKAAAQDYEAAQNSLGYAYEIGRGVEKDHALAAKWYRKAAEAGHPRGMSNYGLALQAGRGVEKDLEEAFKWLMQAAEAEVEDTYNNIGFAYERGLGVDADIAKAVVWYRKGAEVGDRIAMRNIGIKLENGEGVEQDFSEAAKWYRKAAEKGLPSAMRDYGLFLQDGTGVGKDEAASFGWLMKSADNGHERAFNNIGFAYANGIGVEKSETKALEWFYKAAETGDAQAQNNLGIYLRDGLGTEKDLKGALTWFRAAAAQDYEGAAERAEKVEILLAEQSQKNVSEESAVQDLPPDLPVEKIWLGINGEKVGPMSRAEMEQRLVDGKVTPDTLMWKKGMAGWLPIKEAARKSKPLLESADRKPCFPLCDGGSTNADSDLSTEAAARKLLEKFIAGDADRAKLTAQLTPSEDDIRQVYADKLADKLIVTYADLFQPGVAIGPKTGQTKVLTWYAKTDDLIDGKKVLDAFPGGYKHVLSRMKRGHPIVRFKFVEPGKTTGMSFDGLVYVNDRWVFMPKPWRSIR